MTTYLINRTVRVQGTTSSRAVASEHASISATNQSVSLIRTVSILATETTKATSQSTFFIPATNPREWSAATGSALALNFYENKQTIDKRNERELHDKLRVAKSRSDRYNTPLPIL